MKANHLIRKLLLFATLSIFSPSPVEAAAYAIDLISCNPAQQLFLEAQLKRASTIAKFVSLNLGSNMSNRQGWYLNGYIMNYVTLLMGDARDAYVLSAAMTPSYQCHTRDVASDILGKLVSRILLRKAIARFCFDR